MKLNTTIIVTRLAGIAVILAVAFSTNPLYGQGLKDLEARRKKWDGLPVKLPVGLGTCRPNTEHMLNVNNTNPANLNE